MQLIILSAYKVDYRHGLLSVLWWKKKAWSNSSCFI